MKVKTLIKLLKSLPPECQELGVKVETLLLSEETAVVTGIQVHKNTVGTPKYLLLKRK